MYQGLKIPGIEPNKCDSILCVDFIFFIVPSWPIEDKQCWFLLFVLYIPVWSLYSFLFLFTFTQVMEVESIFFFLDTSSSVSTFARCFLLLAISSLCPCVDNTIWTDIVIVTPFFLFKLLLKGRYLSWHVFYGCQNVISRHLYSPVYNVHGCGKCKRCLATYFGVHTRWTLSWHVKLQEAADWDNWGGGW